MKSRAQLRRLLHDWPAKVLSLAAAVLLVVFNNLARLEERYFTVPLQLVLPADYVPASSYADRVRVHLRGDSDEIFRIREEDIEAYADFSDHGTEGVFRESVRTRRRGTALDVDPLEVRVAPLEVSVELERKLVRTVEVVPSLSGFPPPGYELGQYTVSPSEVTVEGPRSRMEDLTSVRTEEIELSGRREDFTVRARLERPEPFIRFPEGDVVEFRGIVEQAVVLHTFEPVEVVILDLDPALSLASALPAGSIRVQGRQADLEAVQMDDVQLVVDASGIREPGSYELPARPTVPRGFLVLRYEPSRIEVRVVPAPIGMLERLPARRIR